MEETVVDIDIVVDWLGVTERDDVCVGVAVEVCPAVTVCDALCELEASWERVWD